MELFSGHSSERCRHGFMIIVARTPLAGRLWSNFRKLGIGAFCDWICPPTISDVAYEGSLANVTSIVPSGISFSKVVAEAKTSEPELLMRRAFLRVSSHELSEETSAVTYASCLFVSSDSLVDSSLCIPKKLGVDKCGEAAEPGHRNHPCRLEAQRLGHNRKDCFNTSRNGRAALFLRCSSENIRLVEIGAASLIWQMPRHHQRYDV